MRRVAQTFTQSKFLAPLSAARTYCSCGAGTGSDSTKAGTGLVDKADDFLSSKYESPVMSDPKDIADRMTVEMAKQLSTKPRPPSGSGIDQLIDYNKEWADGIKEVNPTYFKELSKQQSPQYLWIGCSDSRVPANQIVGLAPGEVFVHRNIANVVARADLNCLSVMQFAIQQLKVEHIIVCGHYGCGGVIAAYEGKRLGLADNWIMHVTDVVHKYKSVLDRCDESNRISALCELNVIAQFTNVVDSHVVQDWWRKDKRHNVDVHGWCYGLADGYVKPLVTMSRNQKLRYVVDDAVNAVERKYRTPMGP